MTSRFSNFEDETGDFDLPLPSISANTSSNYESGRMISNKDALKGGVGSGAAFDDFDSEWDSDGSGGPQRSVSPLLPPSNGTISATSRGNSANISRHASPSLGDESATLALSNPSDLERRARDLDLDDQFGRERYRASKLPQSTAEKSQRSPTGMSLGNFASRARELDLDDDLPSKNDSNRSYSNLSERQDSQLPTMPQIQYEPFSVEPPSHYQNYLYLLKYIHGLKILCGIHMLYIIIAILFKVWYLLSGLVIAPFGFFAVHKLNRKLILIWGVAFMADTLVEAIGALVYSSKPSEEGGGLAPTLVHMVVVLVRSGLVYLIYRFWTKLPENAAEYFALFTSSPEIDRSEMV